MTDNRTTEQRKMLNRLLIELDSLEVVLETPTSGMTLGEYEQEREKLLDGFIQATLGSGTCEFSPTTYNPPTCSNCGWQADAYDCDWLDGGAYVYDGRFCKHCGAKVVGR